MVGVTGFEPATSSSRTKRATKLRHTPKCGASLPKAQVRPSTAPKALNCAQSRRLEATKFCC